MPESTPLRAGLITEQQHRSWIQHCLIQGLPQPQARTAWGGQNHSLEEPFIKRHSTTSNGLHRHGLDPGDHAVNGIR